MGLLRRVLVLVGGAVLVLAAVTGYALEASGVARITTQASPGETRETRVWFVELDGARWLEAGTPENPWFRDVQRDPRLVFVTPDGTSAHRAVVVPERSGEVRAALRDKYGWRDRWVGALVDASRSVAVRLDGDGG